jgi:hypothetical protein
VADHGGEEEEKNFQLCKAIKQLELLQGTNINLDEFLPSTLPNQGQHLQVEIIYKTLNQYYKKAVFCLGRQLREGKSHSS